MDITTGWLVKVVVSLYSDRPARFYGYHIRLSQQQGDGNELVGTESISGVQKWIQGPGTFYSHQGIQRYLDRAVHELCGEAWNSLHDTVEISRIFGLLWPALLGYDEHHGTTFTVVTKTSNLFFRVFTPPKQDNPGSGQINPTFPPGTISFLNGISPIGNKFDFPFETGPAGQSNVATGLYTGEVNFFFGSFPISRADHDVTVIP